MFSTSHYNVEVVLEDDEPEERLLNRFRREVMSAGIIQESKRRKFFENTQDERKRRIRDTAKRNRRLKFPRYVFPIFHVFFFVWIISIRNRTIQSFILYFYY